MCKENQKPNFTCLAENCYELESNCFSLSCCLEEFIGLIRSERAANTLTHVDRGLVGLWE